MEDTVMKKILTSLSEYEEESVEEAYTHLQMAIDHAFYHENILIRQQWQEVERAGETPTPEEFILYLIQKLK